MKIQLLSLAIASSVALFSCSKNHDLTANPSTGANPTIAYQLNVSNPIVPISARVEGGTISWTAGTANASEVRFRADQDSGKVDIRTKTPIQINLFDPLSSLGNITLKDGFYKQVRFDIELEHGGINALDLKGTFDTIPVTFSVTGAFEIESRVNNVIISAVNHNSLTTLNLALLTKGVTASMLNAAIKTNGVIVISETSNTNIYNIMFANLQNAAEHDFH